MKIEELQASLEAHELKMNERSPVKPKQGGMNKRWRGNIKWQGNKHEGKTLHFKANMTILILIRIN